MRKKGKIVKDNFEIPFNDLPILPPANEFIESVIILKQLVKSSVAIAELKGIIHILPNPEILLNAVILKEARASSEIENVITTQDKLYQALSAKGDQIDSSTKEVLRYREAMLFGFRTIQKKNILTINTIVEIQQILEENNAGIRKLPGTALRNSVTGKAIYTPPDQTDVINSLLSNLEKFINLDEDEIPHLVKMAIQHYQFESIHPFYDGNGRTGRIINILCLIMSGLLDQPVLFLSGYIIDNKSEYYRLLQEVRTNNKWEDWILYILKGVEITAQATINQVTEMNTLFEQTTEKTRKEFPKLYSKELIELLFEHPYSKSEYLENRLSISRITAAKYLKALENIGILQSKKVWKETLYINTALFELLKKY